MHIPTYSIQFIYMDLLHCMQLARQRYIVPEARSRLLCIQYTYLYHTMFKEMNAYIIIISDDCLWRFQRDDIF